MFFGVLKARSVTKIAGPVPKKSRIGNTVHSYRPLVKRKVTLTCYVGRNKKTYWHNALRTALQLKVLLRSWASRSGIDWKKFYVSFMTNRKSEVRRLLPKKSFGIAPF